MSVTIRPWKSGKKDEWEVDIFVVHFDGSDERSRLKSPLSGKTASKDWGERRMSKMIKDGPKASRRLAPTLTEFYPKYMKRHPKANRLKPSTIAAQDGHFRVHLIPILGSMRLNEISNRVVQDLKERVDVRSGKTLNNILSTLSMTLKKAVEWDEIEKMPCKVDTVKVTHKEAEFLDFDIYEKVISASEKIGPAEHLTVLLAGEAGLRCGEIMALRWSDLDISRRQITVQRSQWKGHETDPKGRKTRTVPMTKRLKKALHTHQHSVSNRVLCRKDGTGLSQKVIQGCVLRSCRLAHIDSIGPHTLRHTFISHLAMRGIPVGVIQKWAGHVDISTTMKYMHLSPRAIEDAIRMIDEAASASQYPSSGENSVEI